MLKLINNIASRLQRLKTERKIVPNPMNPTDSDSFNPSNLSIASPRSISFWIEYFKLHHNKRSKTRSNFTNDIITKLGTKRNCGYKSLGKYLQCFSNMVRARCV